MRNRQQMAPIGWDEYKLRDIAARITRRNVADNRNILTVSARGLVSQDSYFRRQVASSDARSYYLLHPGDFVYSKSYSTGYPVGIVKRLRGVDTGIVSPLYICFRPDPAFIDERFLEYYFDSGVLNEEVSWIAKEGSRNHGLLNVDVEDFMSLPVLLPPLPEQSKMADILDSIDVCISACKKVIAKQAALRATLSADRLTALVQDTPVVLELSAVSEVLSGVTLGSEPSGPRTVELPYLRVANVQDGHIDTTEMKTIRVLRSALPRYLLREGDVLLTEGGDLDKLGRGAMWDGRIPDCIYQNHIFRVRCDETKVLPAYLSLYIGSPMGKAYFLKIAKQTTNLASINSTQLKQMPLPIPSLADQASLIELMATSTVEIRNERERLTKLQILKQGMMDDLLSGRVRVPL